MGIALHAHDGKTVGVYTPRKVCVCVCVGVLASMCGYVHVWVWVCVRVCACVHAAYTHMCMHDFFPSDP